MHYRSRALSWGDVAGIVAEDVEQETWGAGEVARSGLNEERFKALLGEALNAPGLGELYAMWRRGAITPEQFAHGLRKAKLEPSWDTPLRALHDVLLSPDTLANARQQGFVSVDRQHAESALQGVTSERADVLFELSGNPPGPGELQRALNRGVIDRATFDQAIREGRTKTKYTGFYETMARQLLTASTYVTAFLKGHISRDQMHAGIAQWGYTSEDGDLWYESEGRPASVHQIHIGYARGAKLAGASDEQDAIRKAVAQSDIRPEYADLLYAGRYSYPSAFVLRSLVQSGALTAKEGEALLLESGWKPDLAAKVAATWSGAGSGPTADTHEAKAQTQLWGTTHRSYIAGEIADTQARASLAKAGVPTGSVAAVLSAWQAERELIRKQLTPAQIKRAFLKASKNYATGLPWTRDDALAALLSRGYSVTDANDFLDIPTGGK